MPLSRVPTAQLTGALSFRNRIINGDMRIDQRNNGASVTFAAGSGGAYTVDRFTMYRITSGAFTAQRSATAPTGYTNSLLVTVTTADASVGATDITDISQTIEGFNIADLGWGTSSAQTVTVSFWVRSSVTGTFCCAIRNGTTTRAYVREYTITAANTFQQITLTFPGETSGAWDSNNGSGINLNWSLLAGSTFQTTPNTWTTGNVFATSNQTNLLATTGATFYITGVQLEAGTVATPFERRDFGRELMMCQRYFWKSFEGQNPSGWPGNGFVAGSGFQTGSPSTGMINTTIMNPVQMRAAPTGRVWDHLNTLGKTSSFNPNASNNSNENGSIQATSPHSFLLGRVTGAGATQIGAFLELSAEL